MAVLVVFLAVGVVLVPAGVAGAAGLTAYTPDGDGDYAACAFVVEVAGSVVESGTTYDELDLSAYCNTADTSNDFADHGGMAFKFGGGDMAGYNGQYGAGGGDGNWMEGGDGWLDGSWDISVAGYYFTETDSNTLDDLHGGDALSSMGCDVTDTTSTWTGYGLGPGYGEIPCEVTSFTVGTVVDNSAPGSETPAPPAIAWGSEDATLPSPPAPVVTCTVSANLSSGVAALRGSVTVPSGVTATYDWAYGDSSTDGTALDENHAYTEADEPAGGFPAVLTVTYVGDGSTYAATASSATCDVAVSFLNGSGTGSSGSSGGSAGSTGCSDGSLLSLLDPVSDALCGLELFFVPSSSAVSSFESMMGVNTTDQADADTAGSEPATQWLGGIVALVTTFPGEVNTAIQDGERGCYYDDGGVGNSYGILWGVGDLPFDPSFGNPFGICSFVSGNGIGSEDGDTAANDFRLVISVGLWMGAIFALFHLLRGVLSGGGGS